MTSKEIEQKIAEAFNEHFPGGVTGNLPGYEKAILALIQQATHQARMGQLTRAYRFGYITEVYFRREKARILKLYTSKKEKPND